MAETMDIDGDELRGTKRTAEEAGLPREAPRRIKARHPATKVGYIRANMLRGSR